MTIYNETKNIVSVANELRAGSGWHYDESYLTYDGQYDSITGAPVLYDGIGTTAVVYNESKNLVSVTGESKNNV